MSQLGRLWAGHLYGTNTGKLFLELDDMLTDCGEQKGTLRVADDGLGLSAYAVILRYVGEIVTIDGVLQTEVEDLSHGTIAAKAASQPDGHLSGEWTSSIGTGGTFKLFPHSGAQIGPSEKLPEQIYTNSKDLGALRLYRNDIDEMIATMRRKFPGSRIVISHFDRGAELALFDVDFEAKIQNLDQLKWVKLNVQSTVGGGFTRSLTIDLGQSFNRVTTQGPDESWVLGELEATLSTLRLKQSWLSTAIGKYRLNINLLIFLAAIVAMPDLKIASRALFVGGVLAVVLAADQATQRLVPNFVLNLTATRPNLPIRIWPSALSWIISATAGVAAKIFYDLLQGN